MASGKGGKDFKQSSAEIISDILSDKRVKRGLEYTSRVKSSRRIGSV